MSPEAEATPDRRSHDTPESLRLRSIAPSLTVKDVQASIAWYRDIVGFVVKEEWEHEGKVLGATLVAGSAQLLIGQDDGAKGWDRVKGEGFRLYLNTAQGVDEVANNIKARGGTLATEPADMPWGGRAFSLVDPDGFQLTISASD
jgi:uncharacterized glyoxalase superfamily protein PhnB